MKESKYITIAEALKQKDPIVNLRGWVYRERKSNKFIFLVLRDESDIIQCVISKDKNPEIFENQASNFLSKGFMGEAIISYEKARELYEKEGNILKVQEMEERILELTTPPEVPKLIISNSSMIILILVLVITFIIYHQIERKFLK